MKEQSYTFEETIGWVRSNRPTRGPTSRLRFHDNVIIRCSVLMYEDLMMMSLGNLPLGSPRTRLEEQISDCETVMIGGVKELGQDGVQ